MFPVLNLRISKIAFDGNAYGKLVGKHIRKAMEIAARDFLMEAIKHIPVRTGFLRGAFGNLEDLVGTVEYEQIGKDAYVLGGKGSPRIKVSGRKRYFFVKNRNYQQMKARRQLRSAKLYVQADRLLKRRGKTAARFAVGARVKNAYNNPFFEKAREIQKDIKELHAQIKRMPVGSSRDNMVKSMQARRKEYFAAVHSSLGEAHTHNIIEPRLRDQLKRIIRAQQKMEKQIKKLSAEEVQDRVQKIQFEQYRQDIIKGRAKALGISASVLESGQYYYHDPVGGNAGRRKGFRRGTPILKTRTSGRRFATPTVDIFGNRDYLPGGKVGTSDTGTSSGNLAGLAAQFERMTGKKMDIGPTSVKNASFTFSYYIRIKYYARNDVIYGWLSWLRAGQAFKSKFTTVVREKFPKIQEYLREERITMARGASTTAVGGKYITYVTDLGSETTSEKVN